jgi:hypothetical protein
MGGQRTKKRLFKKRTRTKRHKARYRTLGIPKHPMPALVQNSYKGALSLPQQAVKQLFLNTSYYQNTVEKMGFNESNINELEIHVAKAWESLLLETQPLLEHIDFYTSNALSRIIMYDYMCNKKRLTDVLEAFPKAAEIKNDLYKLKSLYKFIHLLPKGATHHEHNFSIGFTSEFLDSLLANTTIMHKYYLIYMFNVQGNYDTETHPVLKRSMNNSVRLVPKTFVDEMSLDEFNKTFIMVKPKKYLYTTRVEPVAFHKSDIETIIHSLQSDSNGRNSTNLNGVQDCLFLTVRNKHLIENPWTFLEFASDRNKQINTLIDIVPLYLQYIANVAMYENVQEIQIKYNFKSWTYGVNDSYADIQPIDTMKLVREWVRAIFKEMDVIIRFVHGMPRRQIIRNNKNQEKYIMKVMESFYKINELERGLPSEERLVVGYDVYGEEDISNPSSMFYNKLMEFKASDMANVAFMLHSGETSRTVIPADPNALISILLSGSLRVGHGLSLWKYPALLNKMVGKILIEICPLSNGILNYVKDIRNHPAIAIINSGVDISVNSDNRGLLNYAEVTYDWLDLSIGLGLPWVTLKNIGSASTRYSSLYKKVDDETFDRWYEKYKKSLSRYSI